MHPGEDPMSLADFEHHLCPILVERDGRNDGDSGDSMAETTGELRHTFFNGTREDVGRDGLWAPTLGPLLVEHFFEILDRAFTSQGGKETMSELVETRSISQTVSCKNEQIELALLLNIAVRRGRVGRDRKCGNQVTVRGDEIDNSIIQQCPED